MRPAARLTDLHVCPMVTGVVPHVGGPISAPGAPTVLICGLPAARMGDMAVCVGPPDTIVTGAPTVLAAVGGTYVAAALTAGRPPLGPGTAAAVRDLRALLAQVRAEDIAGRYVRGLQLAREAVVVAERSAHDPARAEALLHRARLEASTADFTAAERSYETAYWLAEAIGEDRVRAEAAIDLVEVTGERRGRDHDSMQWARQAEALLRRLGEPPELEERGALIQREDLGEFA